MYREHVKLDVRLLRFYKDIEWLINTSHRLVDNFPNPNAEKRRLGITLASFAAALNYAQATVLLCRAHNDKAPLPLLRAMLENRINLGYMLSLSGDIRALNSTAATSRKRVEMAKKLRDYVVSHPDQIVIKKSVEDIEKIIHYQGLAHKDAVDELKEETGSKKYCDPHLWKKAQVLDSEGDRKDSVYALYLLLYSDWSGFVHLGPDVMTKWLQPRENYLIVNKPATSSSLGFIAWSSYILLAEVLFLTLDEIAAKRDDELANEIVSRGNQIALDLIDIEKAT